MTLPLALLALLILGLAWPLKPELLAAWRDARAALVALVTAALIVGHLLRSQAPAAPAPTVCPPLTQPVNLPARPHEVDHAPPALLDPLPPFLAPDMGSGVPAVDVGDRVRALDVRARNRGR